MHRPLREPFYLRVWHLVRGLLFYNTVYWRRASDGLNMPSLTLEERERQRPERNLEIIRPRVRPRAHLERGAEVSNPATLPTPESSTEEVYEEPTSSVEDNTFQQASSPENADTMTGPVYVKRRRYRRRLVSQGSAIDRGSFLARVFGKK